MKLAPSPAADDSDTLLVAEEIIAVPDSVLINQAIAQAQQALEQSTQTAPATEPLPAKPEKQEVSEPIIPIVPQPAKQEAQEPQPAPAVTAPAASAHTETAMIAAYTDDGKYRAYTVSDWDSFTSAQKAKLQPVGVQLTASGQQFIVAPTDAAGGKEVKWEDLGSRHDRLDVPGLNNVVVEPKRDFNGLNNTNKILAYGRQNGISYPAAEAARNYSVKGHRMGWCLPALGQLNLILENIKIINYALRKSGYAVTIKDISYWSSTEINSFSSWFVGMGTGNVSYVGKTTPIRVRAVAPVPVS